MRKPLLLFALCILLTSLTGCSDLDQVENLAYAEILGIELNALNEIEVSIQVPKIAGQRGESSGGSGESQPLVYSAGGKSFDEALNLLQWAVPRRLDLSQIKLIVISEALAMDDRFEQAAATIMATPRLYTAARFAVCEGSAKEFVKAEKPVIGTRLSTELEATFEDYIRNGFIPDASFADVFLSGKSFYSDSLAIHANGSDPAMTAAAIIPDSAGTSGVEMQNSNRFLGAAVFRQGKMTGRLSGEEYLYCKILQGKKQAFPFIIDGQTVGLTTLGKPSVHVDTSSEPIRISVKLRISVFSSSKNAPEESLKAELTEAFDQVVRTCKAMNAEPFGFAKHAAGSFASASDWLAFDWQKRFSESDVDIQIDISSRT